ncbi:hypothetical protein AAC387_Pa05g1963 [Persea americana]
MVGALDFPHLCGFSAAWLPHLQFLSRFGIMSYDQPSSATASIVQGCGSCESHVSPVTFNIDGQPISDNVATQEKSKLGKATRQAMRCPHNSGRKGQVRVADELRRKNPDKEIKRTDVRLETHTKKDGFASCEEADIWIKTRWHGCDFRVIMEVHLR